MSPILNNKGKSSVEILGLDKKEFRLSREETGRYEYCRECKRLVPWADREKPCSEVVHL